MAKWVAENIRTMLPASRYRYLPQSRMVSSSTSLKRVPFSIRSTVMHLFSPLAGHTGGQDWSARTIATKFRGQVKPVAIHSQIHTSVCGNLRDGFLFLAIFVLNAADCHNPLHTFQCGTWQETEFQFPPFYIKSPPV
jgi:hypothetical protein